MLTIEEMQLISNRADQILTEMLLTGEPWSVNICDQAFNRALTEHEVTSNEISYSQQKNS